MKALQAPAAAEHRAALAELRNLLRTALSRNFGRQLDPGDLDDITQESLLRIHAGLASFERKSRFTTWASAIAVHCALSEVRRRRYRLVRLEDAIAEGHAALARDAEPLEAHVEVRLERLRRGIAEALTERQREATLAKLGGLPLMEIARRLGTSQGAVYKPRTTPANVLACANFEADTAAMLGGPSEAELRGRAEVLLRARHQESDADNSLDAERVVEELHLHQVELELQNEQLRLAELDLVRQNEGLRAVERQLELSSSCYRDLFDLAPAGYVSINAMGFVDRANRVAGVLLGVSQERIRGRSLSDFTTGADLRALRAHLRAASKGHDACEVRLRHSDGRIVQVLLESRPARDGGCLMVLNDISERRRAEQALSRANLELEARVVARTQELASRNAALEEALAAHAASEAERSELAARLRDAERLESLGLLAGGIAHDFNNLLVGVMANADLLLETRSDLDPAVREGLDTIKDAAHDAAGLTRKLLVYAGRGQVVLQLVQLDDLVRECVRLLQATAPACVQLRAELGSGEHWINADAGQVRQVVVNLVTNAFEAVGDGAANVVVRTRVEEFDAQALARFSVRTRATPGRFVVLEVEDTGVGIAAEQLSRIFEPFYTSKFTGRGLGLASVRGIVRGHDAALSVQSALGQGTTFQIAWSLADVPAAPKEPAVRAAPWRGSGQALLVDDDPVVRRALARQLELLGFEVTEADSGEGALEIFRATPAQYCLAVVDRTMPGLSGDLLIELLHEIEPALPVVLVSGYSAMGPVAANERVVFLAKPMTVAGLRQVVSNLLDAG